MLLVLFSLRCGINVLFLFRITSFRAIESTSIQGATGITKNYDFQSNIFLCMATVRYKGVSKSLERPDLRNRHQ